MSKLLTTQFLQLLSCSNFAIITEDSEVILVRAAHFLPTLLLVCKVSGIETKTYAGFLMKYLSSFVQNTAFKSAKVFKKQVFYQVFSRCHFLVQVPFHFVAVWKCYHRITFFLTDFFATLTCPSIMNLIAVLGD